MNNAQKNARIVAQEIRRKKVFQEVYDATFAQSASIHLAVSENPQGYVLLSGKNSFSIVVPSNNFLLNISAPQAGLEKSYVPMSLHFHQ